MVFLVGGKDYSKNVIAGEYMVNEFEKYISWVNANNREFRRPLISKVTGSIGMFFKTELEYKRFYNDLQLAKQTDSTYLITLTVNNTGVNKPCNMYIEFELVRNKNLKSQDVFETFTLELQEA